MRSWSGAQPWAWVWSQLLTMVVFHLPDIVWALRQEIEQLAGVGAVGEGDPVQADNILCHLGGEETLESDLDILVDVTGETTPWFPGSMVADLEQLLGRRVQVVIRRSLSPQIRESVLREAVPL